uniref:G-protein coupled receptors family 1 profile domain-containing protein n=1 Tax=Sus scrofa TaxID=9823 RepID=A0A8D0QS98_PIG
MATENHSTVTEFILGGLTSRPELQLPLFLLFLGIYSITMLGNLGMVTLIWLSAQLHTPMYYFLSNLSLVDLCYSSAITPKMLVNFVSEKNTISYAGCMFQLYLFIVFVIAECYMLTVMAYDRYVAICRPLFYNTIMSHQVCSLLVVTVYAIALIDSTVETDLILKLSYCERFISHYFCDIVPLMKFSCSNTYDVEMTTFFLAGLNIIHPVQHPRICTLEGRSKAFNTCGFHLAATGLFYGSATFMYLKPSTASSLAQENVASVFYTTMIPMLNPLIYSLRNKEVKAAMHKTLRRKLIGAPSQRRMATENHSTVTEFILGGLTSRPELQLPLFLLFLGIYSITMLGNLGMITLIWLSAQLHTPMYYFLSNLSLVDLCYSSVTAPKMLVNFVSEKNTISYTGCMCQLYFFLVFVIAECYMLTVMAYDRYVAICRPLFYNTIMSHQVCSLLVVTVYAMGLIGSTIETGMMLKVPYCEPLISHYFCDILPLMKLSCSNTYDVEVTVFFLAGFNIVVTGLMVLISYAFILSSILHISTTEGRSKAFSTCSSHLMAVGMFYGTTAFMYLKPSTASSLAQENVASVFYTTVIPMLNPLIYSLRSKEVKAAMQKTLRRKIN